MNLDTAAHGESDPELGGDIGATEHMLLTGRLDGRVLRPTTAGVRRSSEQGAGTQTEMDRDTHTRREPGPGAQERTPEPEGVIGADGLGKAADRGDGGAPIPDGLCRGEVARCDAK